MVRIQNFMQLWDKLTGNINFHLILIIFDRYDFLSLSFLAYVPRCLALSCLNAFLFPSVLYSPANRTSPVLPFTVIKDPSSMSFMAFGRDTAGKPYSRERHEKCAAIPPDSPTIPLTILKAEVQPGSVL